MSNISNEKIEDFVAITGSNKERARFYLEAANGDLDAAIGNFFENGGSNEEPMDQQGAARVNPNVNRFNQNNDDEDDDDDDDEDYNIDSDVLRRFNSKGSAAAAAPATNKPTTRSTGASSKIHTLRDGGDDEDDQESEGKDKGQAFYAGGSETSGQQIIGPPRKNAENIIKDLFRKAKEHGAQEVDTSEQTSSKKTPVVYGTGYRLGTGDEPSEVIQGPPRPKAPKVHVLKLWKNGFTVDDGNLRSYQDPQNKEFLQCIEKGAPPKELIKQAEGAEVNLDMQDHRDEEYVPPKNKYVLFNDGYKLGTPTPTVSSNASPNEQASNETLAKNELKVDESKPTTQVQVRLSNGSRLIIKANHTHKIKDLRRYLNRAKPEYNGRVYVLMTSFPNKEITNEDQTLSEANLLNAVIIQTLKQ